MLKRGVEIMKLQGTMQVNSRGHLSIGGCDTLELVQQFGTPLYVLDEALLRQKCRDYFQAFVTKYPGNKVVYAAKAFFTMAMAEIIRQEKLGLDVVSGGELYTALQAGFPAEEIYFHGNNKSAAEIEDALINRIGHFVVDNFSELELLNQLSAKYNQISTILLRISPGIETSTHRYIRTGQIDSKFGLPIITGQACEIVKKALAAEYLDLKGLHCHLGSQVFKTSPFTEAAEMMMDFLGKIKKETGVELTELNLGGGFGIYYADGDNPSLIEDIVTNIMNTVARKAAELQINLPRVIIEPGRSIVGNAGTTLYTIGSCKTIPQIRTYVAVDGGMGDNPRPALYQAKYEAVLANKMWAEPREIVTIVGKYCESGDLLISDLKLPVATRGDILAVFSTGAYNYSMSSNYNRLPRPATVLVRDGQADLIVARESYQDLVGHDLVPERIKLNGSKEDFDG